MCVCVCICLCLSVCVLTFPNYCQQTLMTTEVGLCLLFFEVSMACLDHSHLHTGEECHDTCTIRRESTLSPGLIVWSRTQMLSSPSPFPPTPLYNSAGMVQYASIHRQGDVYAIKIMLPHSLCLLQWDQWCREQYSDSLGR